MRLLRLSCLCAVLAAGWLLGGQVGVGTVLFAVTIGPNVHFWLERLALPGVLEPADGVMDVE